MFLCYNKLQRILMTEQNCCVSKTKNDDNMHTPNCRILKGGREGMSVIQAFEIALIVKPLLIYTNEPMTKAKNIHYLSIMAIGRYI